MKRGADRAALSEVLTGPAPASPYLEEAAAAAYLKGVSAKTLKQWRWSGRGGPRYRKHGTSVVYHVKDLDAWSDARARLTTSDIAPHDEDAPSKP